MLSSRIIGLRRRGGSGGRVYKAWTLSDGISSSAFNGLTTNDFYRQIGVVIFQELHQVGFTVDQNR